MDIASPDIVTMDILAYIYIEYFINKTAEKSLPDSFEMSLAKLRLFWSYPNH